MSARRAGKLETIAKRNTLVRKTKGRFHAFRRRLQSLANLRALGGAEAVPALGFAYNLDALITIGAK